MEKYKAVWKPIRETINLRDRADLDEQVLLDARQDPCSGVWLTRENSEEESRVSDDSVVDSQEVAESIGRLNNTLDVLDDLDRDHGEVSEEDDEAWMEEEEEEEEESPRSRWRRYVQSGQDEVSEPDEWADIHCGPSTPISTPRKQRSRPRETPMCTQSTPMPRAMQKVFAYRRDQRLVGERGEDMVRHAESEQERRGVRQAGGKRGSKGSASSSMMATTVSLGATANDNQNHFADSYSVAQCFDMGMVHAMMQPSMIIVGTWSCKEWGQKQFWSTTAESSTRSLPRAWILWSVWLCNDLLRHLHGLMVKFQWKDPLQWIDAVFLLKDWLQAERDWSFFDEGSTENGSEKHEEGKEESHGDGDDAIDPQDLHHGSHCGPGDGEPDRGGDTAVVAGWLSEIWESQVQRNQ